MYQNIKTGIWIEMDNFSSIDHHKMHCIPLPQYVFSTYYFQPYFRLKHLDKLMHYMVPLFFYTHTLVIEEDLYYI